MSVAFRRESDEEHLEPRFEIPLPPGPNLVTSRGLALIDERIAALDAELSQAADDVARTALRRDLRYWHTRRTTAVETHPPADGTIGFGSLIEVRMAGGVRSLRIVGDDEADPAAGLVAHSAPLARALRDAEAGETVPFNGREDAIRILSVGA